MTLRTNSLGLALLLAAGCGHDSPPGSVSAGAKQVGHDVAQTAKDAGHTIGEATEAGLHALEEFATKVGNNVSETSAEVGRDIEAQMPEVERLAGEAKAKLQAGGAEAKAMAGRLGDKMAVLKDKLAALAKSGAAATVEMKNDAVAAFRDVVADIKSGLSNAG